MRTKNSCHRIYPKSQSSGVKINSDLLKDVEEFINLEENKFKYANKRQFVDIAVADYLQRVKKRIKNGK